MKETTTKDLRQFGIVLGVILGVLGGIHFLKGNYNVYPWFFGFGLAALFIGVIFPRMLKVPFKVFTRVAHAIGWFNTRVILILLYYLILTPIGLVMRLFKKDPLNRRIDRKAESCWIKREKAAPAREDLERQF